MKTSATITRITTAILAGILWGLSLPLTAQTDDTGSPADAPASEADKITARYHVIDNTEGGLVCEVYQPRTEHLVIPGAGTSTGGGGGRAVTTTTWRSTGRTVFIPHTDQTRDFEFDHKFYASTRPLGKSQRISPIQVVPIHQLQKILPAPQKIPRQVAPSGTTPTPPPQDPFKKGR